MVTRTAPDIALGIVLDTAKSVELSVALLKVSVRTELDVIKGTALDVATEASLEATESTLVTRGTAADVSALALVIGPVLDVTLVSILDVATESSFCVITLTALDIGIELVVPARTKLGPSNPVVNVVT